MTSLKPLTRMHLTATRMMPPRKPHDGVLVGKAHQKFRRQLLAERRAIAEYYRLLRSGTVSGYGPEQARITHRYAVVKTGVEAKTRIRNMKG